MVYIGGGLNCLGNVAIVDLGDSIRLLPILSKRIFIVLGIKIIRRRDEGICRVGAFRIDENFEVPFVGHGVILCILSEG